MKTKTRIALLTALSLTLVLALPVLAQGELAKVENLGDTLVFHPQVEFAQLILTVTGPCGFQYRQVVTEGEPYFRLDETTIDGIYRLDLVRIEEIDPGIIEILQAARAKNDEETPKALCRDGKLPPAPISQSFGFRVFEGRILWDPEVVEKAGGGDFDAPAGITTKDFVIIDDLIVDGSACIGFDCVNGESFGFDTIRLKENNLRIKFDDTSTAASFPRNDWQLTANDSANGGASKFSIDDISGNRTPFTVEANARSHALYVDDGGRIGSRTSTPSVEIHTIDGDTPTLRLQQDGSSGFAPQTWDVAGNETNFFVRDVTNGSTLPFRIRPSAPTSSIFIDVDGDVGLGTSSPDAKLHVLSTAAGVNDLLHLENSNATSQEVRIDFENANATWRFQNASGGNLAITKVGSGGNELFIRERNDPAGDPTFEVDGSVQADNVVFASSRAFKTDFVSLDAGEILAKVVGLDVSSWRFKDLVGVRHIGPVAEDWSAAFNLGGSDKHVSAIDLGGVALSAIQGLHQELEEVKAEKAELQSSVHHLESSNTRLQEEIAELKALVNSLLER